MLFRSQKLDLALNICDYVLNCAPKNFHLQFKKKQEWFTTILYRNKPNNHRKGNQKGEKGDLGLKLKEALKKRD